MRAILILRALELPASKSVCYVDEAAALPGQCRSIVQSGDRTRARANVAYLRGGAGRCRFPSPHAEDGRSRTPRSRANNMLRRCYHIGHQPLAPPSSSRAITAARSGQNLGRAPGLDGCLESSSRCQACECALRRAADRNLADRRLRPRNRCLLSQLRLQPEFDEAADGFGSARLIGLFCCPGIHIVPEYGRQSDGSYRVLTGCRTPPFFS